MNPTYKKILSKTPLWELICWWFNKESKKRYGLMRWQVLIDFVKKNNYTKIVEIGVAKGENAEHILKKCKLEKYFLIDPFIHKPFYKKAIKYKSVVFLKAKSEDVAKTFENKSLDLVFVDGDHSYEAVKRDIEMWLPKIRKGGLLIGHDYCDKWLGVRKAVDEMLKKITLVPIEYKVNNSHNNIFYVYV